MGSNPTLSANLCLTRCARGCGWRAHHTNSRERCPLGWARSLTCWEPKQALVGPCARPGARRLAAAGSQPSVRDYPSIKRSRRRCMWLAAARRGPPRNPAVNPVALRRTDRSIEYMRPVPVFDRQVEERLTAGRVGGLLHRRLASTSQMIKTLTSCSRRSRSHARMSAREHP